MIPEAREAVGQWLDSGAQANPSSDHAAGRRALAAVEQARAEVAALIGAAPREIIWTSGATEANNLAIKGAVEFNAIGDAHVITSRIEHRCVLESCRALEARSGRNLRVSYLEPDRQGRVSPQAVLDALTPRTLLVSLMWANNEIGSLNDIQTLAHALSDRGVLLHVDAAQAVGKLPIDLGKTPVSLMSLSGHKLGGPPGIGALFVRQRPRVRLEPQMHGGGHEQGMRSGTLAVHQIIALGAACKALGQSLEADIRHMAALRDQLAGILMSLPGVHRNGGGSGAAPHILNLSFEGVHGEALRAALPGLAVSSGAACTSANAEPSYVLRALGRDDELAGASLRFSFCPRTRRDEVAQAGQWVIEQVQRLRALSPEKMK